MNTAFQIALTAAGFAALGCIVMAVISILDSEFYIPEEVPGGTLLIIIVALFVAVVSSMIGIWI